MYLEAEDFFHSHLWMLSLGNDLGKSRTFSSVLLSREKCSIYTEIRIKNFFESFHTLSLSFVLESSNFFFPFLFVLTLEADSFSFSPVKLYYTIQQHSV